MAAYLKSWIRSFNEAGVRDAGDPQRSRTCSSRRTSFNEAGVRDAGDPHPHVVLARWDQASTRPAYVTPEI